MQQAVRIPPDGPRIEEGNRGRLVAPDPASLVSNISENVGHHLNVRLHAVTTARDAFGTVVRVRTASRNWTRQLTAGAGFMASNERVVQFGLGAETSITDVSIHWPSGQTTVITSPPVDVTIEAVEGRHLVDQ